MKKIYVAEDNPLQMDVMKMMLGESESFAASFFTDGLELYQRTLRDRPDLLVLDIILPNLSGLAISRLLKFHDLYSYIPIIMVSSITDPEIRNQVRTVGADIFLAKPINMEELMFHIRSLLNIQGRLEAPKSL